MQFKRKGKREDRLKLDFITALTVEECRDYLQQKPRKTRTSQRGLLGYSIQCLSKPRV